MKMLMQKEYQEIRMWMHRNARPLEMAVWNYFFEGGARDEIADALAYYQNDDGGFGNGVEPDCWNAESSPYATLTAIVLLRETGFVEEAGTEHPMIQGIFRFLESGKHSDENGWFFGIPSNDTYPRAPWHSYDEERNREEGMGVTAALSAFILHYGKRDSELFARAAGYSERILKAVSDADGFGDMGVGGVVILLTDILQCGLTELFDGIDFKSISARMMEVANCSMERDPRRWEAYTPRPSEFIGSPDAPLYRGNEEIVETELDYLIDTRIPGGVWNITWTWFALGDRYPKEFAISENWWMASKAIEKVRFLKNFGRIG